MRNNLNGVSAEVTVSFLLEDTPVNLTGGDIRIFIKTFIYETLVVTQIKRQDSMAMIESLLSFILPFVLIVVMMNFLMKRVGGVGKSTAKIYMQKETGVTFADVAGEDEAKGIPGRAGGFPA